MAYPSVYIPTLIPAHSLPVHSLIMTDSSTRLGTSIAKASELVRCFWRVTSEGVTSEKIKISLAGFHHTPISLPYL